jgi:hypothetical protein
VSRKQLKRVAILGADFSPSSLPSALRLRFFAQHLQEFGWQPIVITTDPKFYDREMDAENERLLPPSLEVIRTRALSSSWTRKVGLGDIGLRSLWYHWRALVQLCRERKVDLLFITGPPHAPMILGRLAKMLYGLPYVLDYQDPWVTDFYWKLPRAQRPPKWAFAYALARTLEPFALKRADRLVTVSSGTSDSVMARYARLKGLEPVEIPLGGERGDFDYIRSHPRTAIIFNPGDGLHHVSYVGAISHAMTPMVRAICLALRAGLLRAPELFGRLRLHFIGTSYAANASDEYKVLPLAHEAGVEKLVDEQPERVSYLDSLQLLFNSQALILIGSEEPHYTASKIFPYILARKPLLAVFHEASSVVNIMRETRAGNVVTYNSASQLESRIEEISEEFERLLLLPGEYEPPTCWEAFEPYTTRAMTARLAEVFDRIVDQNKI